jgi:ABC-type phosphate transport system auxiliary subunit
LTNRIKIQSKLFVQSFLFTKTQGTKHFVHPLFSTMPKGKKEITKIREKRNYDKERYQRRKEIISIQRKEKYLKNSNSEKSLLKKKVKILEQELEQVRKTSHTSTQEKFHLELQLGKIIILTLDSLTTVYLELNQAYTNLEIKLIIRSFFQVQKKYVLSFQ